MSGCSSPTSSPATSTHLDVDVHPGPAMRGAQVELLAVDEADEARGAEALVQLGGAVDLGTHLLQAGAGALQGDADLVLVVGREAGAGSGELGLAQEGPVVFVGEGVVLDKGEDGLMDLGDPGVHCDKARGAAEREEGQEGAEQCGMYKQRAGGEGGAGLARTHARGTGELGYAR